LLQLNFVSILGISAVLLSLLVAVKVVLQPAQDRMAKALLLFFLVCLTALMVNHLYRYRVTRLYLVFPHFSGSTLMLTYCLGPALYAYVRRLALGARPWDQRFWFLHWLLPIALELYLIRTFGRSTQEQFASFRSEQAGAFRLFLYLANYLQILTYVLLCRGPLRIHQQRIADDVTDARRVGLNWLQRVCRGLVVLVLLAAIAVLSGKFHSGLYSLLLVASALFIVVIAYSALGHGELLLSPPPAATTGGNLEADANEEKYARSGMQTETAHYYLNKLQTLMAKERYFLDDSLSLSSLAEKLNMSSHHLSQLLNEQLQTPFYDYINTQRIEYAKQMLRDHPRRSIVDIACASGYDNKGTFYRAFKRNVGMTPAEYRKRRPNPGPDRGSVTTAEISPR